uniref:Uncharacterized protein n=1 Tax=Oryza meridionalis TaxID=40149 RepID=A0A0E0CVQ3_9ORYZ
MPSSRLTIRAVNAAGSMAGACKGCRVAFTPFRHHAFEALKAACRRWLLPNGILSCKQTQHACIKSDYQKFYKKILSFHENSLKFLRSRRSITLERVHFTEKQSRSSPTRSKAKRDASEDFDFDPPPTQPNPTRFPLASLQRCPIPSPALHYPHPLSLPPGPRGDRDPPPHTQA